MTDTPIVTQELARQIEQVDTVFYFRYILGIVGEVQIVILIALVSEMPRTSNKLWEGKA